MEEEKIKNFLREIEKENFVFTPHFYDKKMEDRPYLSEDLIISSLKNLEKIEKVEQQIVKGETRYRITVQISNKYNLAIVVKIDFERQNLYIISAWKTNRKWQNKMQK